ncbi:MAG TPA: CDP-diacylglycerol diphosphatase [Nitrospirota bacterium]|nr:CDP-diacylglycerol diphosphatase [Nitrospirota bacterium]
MNRRACEMKSNCHEHLIRAALLCLVLFFSVIVTSCAKPAATPIRNVLLEIVTSCIDVDAPGYCDHCIAPRTGSPCAAGRGCRETTDVWAETKDYIVMRDRKMCGCPADFVHGLVIPRTPVIGVEDQRKPDGIWKFAWEAARKKIANESEIALAVNPPDKRNQDQLHIHIARLNSNVRPGFDSSRKITTRSLDDVWRAAAKKAEEAELLHYGILVAKEGEAGFVVVVADESTEKAFTQWGCR